MRDQTPVQPAWVIRDLDATEAVSGVVADARVPHLEIAYVSPEVRAFFDYVKQEQV